MLRPTLLSSLVFLSACSHYQNLNQEADQVNNDNRYSQNRLLLTSDKQTPLAVSNTKTIPITSAPSVSVTQTQTSDTQTSDIQVSDTHDTAMTEPSPKKVIDASASSTASSHQSVSSKPVSSKKVAVEEPQQESIIWQKIVSIFSIEKVKPWQKSTLAKETMKPGGITPGSEKFNQKVFLSKESSRGGLGVAGGGCGCN